MNVFIWFLIGAYFVLAIWSVYQAVMLDRYRKTTQELMRKVEYLEPPF